MKKIVLIAFAFLLAVASLSAEDTIFLKNGEKLVVKIFRIDDDNIYYRHVGEEIDYQISKQKVSEIAFQNGRKEIFGPDIDKKIKLRINNPKRECVIVNDDYKVEDKLYVINEAEENTILSVYGQHYEYQDIVPLEINARIPADGKPHRVAKRIEKGKLDHYSAFMFVSNNDCFFKSFLYDDNLYIRLMEQNDSIELHEFLFDAPIKDYFWIHMQNESASVQVFLYDNKGNLVLDTGILPPNEKRQKFLLRERCIKAKVVVKGHAKVSLSEIKAATQILIVK